MITAIYFVLDRSGSMYSCLDDTLGGFNSFVNKQKQDNPNGEMSLFLFSDTIKTEYKNKPIQYVNNLTADTYVPAGSTALCDAIGHTIKFAEKDTQNEKKIIVILTDGFENSSKSYTKLHINDLISHHNDWQFVFLAANQDAIQSAETFGINKHSAMTFGQEKVTQAFEGLSAAIGRQVTGESQNVEFTELERSESSSQVPVVKLGEIFC